MAGEDCTLKHSLAFPRAQSHDYLLFPAVMHLCFISYIYSLRILYPSQNVVCVTYYLPKPLLRAYYMPVLTLHYIFDLDSTCAHVSLVYRSLFDHHFCLPFVESICLVSLTTLTLRLPCVFVCLLLPLINTPLVFNRLYAPYLLINTLSSFKYEINIACIDKICFKH